MIKKHLQLGLLLMVSLFFPCLALTEQEKALFKACEEHDHLKINQLLAEGVNINVLNEKQQTPLYVAIDTFNFDAEEDIKKVVATLLHNNANPNLGEGYFFPLCTAVETGYKSIVKLLIDYAADTAIFFASGDT
ncbi:MAG: ankyrin repeat domain-containing protein, partial [Bacteroidota bacterium]